MSSSKSRESKDDLKPLKRVANASDPVTLSPVNQLEVMTRGRIKALEQDKRKLQAEVDRLRELVALLAPKNARLEEALSNAEANSVLATILIGGGGFLVSYATFTGKAAGFWADFSAGCLMAGIFLLFFQSFRRWRRERG